ncbi:response regulator transcription factor [Kribbella sp. VKM Ac-2568]|uniref:response regulator transcription factor n=1 Tax=Kribbella sp. VKM Ac-2568 TaxID=2512219 RepID=UPI0010CF94A5|nr:response regulator transcription factor [Kribbella sp. VKM Ac-2568]TCM35971.1 DNA-binding NarL/FixJ family response regulator [Kribbella sp. VKM Ac-2568]
MARVLLYATARLFAEAVGACLRRDDLVDDLVVVHDSLAVAGTAWDSEVDIVLYDITASGALSAVRDLTDQLVEVPVVALTASPSANDVIAYADAGLVAWVPRDATLEELVGVLGMALRGETTCDPRVTRSLVDELRRRRESCEIVAAAELLTRREAETVRLLEQGYTNKEIAAELYLSVATVKNHVHAVLSKLELTRRAQVGELLREKPWLLRSA